MCDLPSCAKANVGDANGIGTPLYLAHYHVLGGLGVINAACRVEQINDNFIAHPDDIVFLKFARLKFTHGVVRQSGKRGKNFRLILFQIGCDHQINVHGGAVCNWPRGGESRR